MTLGRKVVEVVEGGRISNVIGSVGIAFEDLVG
jgi:hypothetical protein